MVKYKLFFGDSNVRMFQHLPEVNESYKMLSIDEYKYESMDIYKYNYTNGENVMISVFSFVGASAVGLSKERNSKLQVGEHIMQFLRTLEKMEHNYEVEVYLFFGCVDIDFTLWYQQGKSVFEFIEYAANAYIDFIRILKKNFKGVKINIMGIHPPSITDEYFEKFCKTKELKCEKDYIQSFEHRIFYHDMFNRLLFLYCRYDGHVYYKHINDKMTIPAILNKAIETSQHDVHIDLNFALKIWNELLFSN